LPIFITLLLVLFFFFSSYGDHRDLHSFPTRRSSDLQTWLLVTSAFHMPRSVAVFRAVDFPVVPWPTDYRTAGNEGLGLAKDNPRSEEHTSELQSRENLVCRLLLEKKKNQNNEIKTIQ